MYSKFVKRLFDLILSLLGIIISSPIWIITILLILINDFGPIFYCAKRVGRDNKIFKMYKFRSMRVLKKGQTTNESSLRPDEERIFFVGRIIRKLKIDELPQLINIFIGNMSIVGPRPISVDQIEIFKDNSFELVNSICPGLTGPAALYDYIYGDQFTDENIDEYINKVLPTRKKLEVVYVKKISFIFDFCIIVFTAWSILCSIFKITPKKILKFLLKIADN